MPSSTRPPRFSFFLSVVLVVRNQTASLDDLVVRAAATISPLVSDYELIVVDNASEDDSVALLKRLTGRDGQPNLQVYALTKEVDIDTACWVGVENALGDFVAVIDPARDDMQFLPHMLAQVEQGVDVVFARNETLPPRSYAYRMCSAVFNHLYQRFNDLHLTRDAPRYRVLSRRVINSVLQQPLPVLSYQHLPATGGFAKVTLNYSTSMPGLQKRRLGDSFDRGMRLLLSTTRGPMRLVTTLSLFGAAANLAYSVYVVLVGLFKADVASGWISLSLQQSGMFMLLSLVLLVLGEYILNMVRLSNEGPSYHVAQEFTSERMTREEKLNIEIVSAASRSPVDSSMHAPGSGSATSHC
ncbi:MAG: glycosyltransferase [Burkholderiaceae bacterium]